MKLPPPARYFPIEKGLYEVAPGLRVLGTDFGNGAADRAIFQIDSEFAKFRASKLAARAERLDKYYITHELSPEVERAAVEFLLDRLMSEHPSLFSFARNPDGIQILNCALTQEALKLDSDLKLLDPGPHAYASALDALCCQIQEDFAILSTRPSTAPGENPDWISCLHLCSPSHWAAEDKIGKNFIRTHEPVPGIERINRAAASFVEAMIHKGPYTRFVWGFASDTRLNHHPEAPSGVDPMEWKGRAIGSDNPFVLRIERQVTHGLPKVGAAIFTIRIYFISGEEIRSNPEECALLRSALLSMTPESRVYKGLAKQFDEVIAWLDERASP